MGTREIRKNLYKVLRKTGVPRAKIVADASLTEDLFIDDIDMKCFLFYLETNFRVNILNEELPQINSVESTVAYLQQHCA